MKKILCALKKILVSGLILYGYNIAFVSIGCIIPMNIITISSVSIFGIPALFSFIIIQKIIF